MARISRDPLRSTTGNTTTISLTFSPPNEGVFGILETVQAAYCFIFTAIIIAIFVGRVRFEYGATLVGESAGKSAEPAAEAEAAIGVGEVKREESEAKSPDSEDTGGK